MKKLGVALLVIAVTEVTRLSRRNTNVHGPALALGEQGALTHVVTIRCGHCSGC